jgi:glycosyltransferase involved in cell wall biosynthesis
LHGIETIVEAAMRSDPARHRWTLFGTGQEAPRIRRLLEQRPVRNIEWIDWVPYERLQEQIAAADMCLGIFGTSGKAERVIPNKAFQIVAAGRPLVTRDSPAIRELVPDGAPGIRLVPAGNADALLAAIDDLASRDERIPSELAERFSTDEIGTQLVRLLRDSTRR